MQNTVNLATIVTPDGLMRISLEPRGARRVLIGRVAGLPDQQLSEQTCGQGNTEAVAALGFIRARYSEPRHQLHVSAWWRNYVHLGSLIVRGLWHMTLHRGKFSAPPGQCVRCNPASNLQ